MLPSRWGNAFLVRVAVCLLLGWSCQGKKPSARRDDVPLIKCQVCKHIAINTFQQVAELRATTKPKKFTEMTILGVTEKICKVNREQGDWIQWLDMVESGEYIELQEQPYKGECMEECKTIEKACDEVMGFADTDVAEFMYTHPAMGLEDFYQELCSKLTGACRGPTPKIPQGRKPGPAFVQKSQKEIEREEMLRNIEGKQERYAEENPDAPRMPKMKLYSRDDLMKKTMMTGREGEEEDEEEEEEDDELEKEEEQGGGASSGKQKMFDAEIEDIAKAMRDAEQASFDQKQKTEGNEVGGQTWSWLDAAREQLLQAAASVWDGLHSLKQQALQWVSSKGAKRASQGSSQSEL